jgi:hypothetical protein
MPECKAIPYISVENNGKTAKFNLSFEFEIYKEKEVCYIFILEDWNNIPFSRKN